MVSTASTRSALTTVLVSLSILLDNVKAQSTGACSASVSSRVPAPSVAPGYEARLVAGGLESPRGIQFDSAGHLLVVEEGRGVTALTFADGGGACVQESRRQAVVDDSDLNHGIALSGDGVTLYASSPEAVFSWPYSASGARTTSDRTRIVSNMTTSDHTTRTLLLSRKANGTLVVTRGSTSNIDTQAEMLDTGHSQVKAFNLPNRTGTYDFNRDGKLLGWGLRNDVGIDEEPISGGLYSVENSADELTRDGKDIHQNNPGEEMNFLGYLSPRRGPFQNETSKQGGNFGYPECFSAWDTHIIPNFKGDVGTQFSLGQNATNNDTACASDYVAPRLTFQAHMAPLDIKFNTAGTAAWISWHGSWDRSSPSGYKVGAVQFSNGSPVDGPTSKTALTDIVSNQDNSKCPDECFRPVGLAWDNMGRLFFSSDKTGEIYVIARSGGDPSVDNSTPSATSPGPAQTSSKASMGSAQVTSPGAWWLLIAASYFFV